MSDVVVFHTMLILVLMHTSSYPCRISSAFPFQLWGTDMNINFNHSNNDSQSAMRFVLLIGILSFLLILPMKAQEAFWAPTLRPCRPVHLLLVL
jgi:hypothetical protein